MLPITYAHMTIKNVCYRRVLVEKTIAEKSQLTEFIEQYGFTILEYTCSLYV